MKYSTREQLSRGTRFRRINRTLKKIEEVCGFPRGWPIGLSVFATFV